jgi:hypothetical protein
MASLLNTIQWSDYFYIDETSPSGIRRSNHKYLQDKPAGVINRRKDGTLMCWRIQLKSLLFMVHRVIWVMTHGHLDDDALIDHLDGNPLNNAISNLRVVTSRINNQNMGKSSANKSGVTGVRYETKVNESGRVFNYWKAQWRDCNKKQHSSYYSTDKYGYDGAFNLAVERRKLEMEKLVAEGMFYTKRHMGM